jgi:hypothetical protein
MAGIFNGMEFESNGMFLVIKSVDYAIITLIGSFKNCAKNNENIYHCNQSING